LLALGFALSSGEENLVAFLFFLFLLRDLLVGCLVWSFVWHQNLVFFLLRRIPCFGLQTLVEG
jgi:hypothetical protein